MQHRSHPRTELDAVVAEQELRSFSYIVSHDLAASLRHLTEFTRLLIKDLGDGVTGRQQAHAEHVRAAGEKCQAMLDQLLIFSRLQQKVLEWDLLDANLIVEASLRQFAAQIKAPGSEISVESLGQVHADADLLGLAIRHLLDNAIKFRSPGAPLRIAVRAHHDDAWWRMRITDGGVGVEAAYREKAFEMFGRLNGENVYPGVGAGLAICRRIARRHSGDVRFIDCAQGCCVELALPRRPVLHYDRHASPGRRRSSRRLAS